MRPGVSSFYPRGQLAAVPTPIVKTHARFVPERLDDFAWESDRIAHRVYGPGDHDRSQGEARQQRRGRLGEIRRVIRSSTSGIKSGDYHADRGEGLDNYKVGPARGCGGLGIWDGKKLHVSANFKTWKVLANGPLRSVFELTYDTWDIPGNKVSETKRISIDAGSNFSRVESTFKLVATDKPGKLKIGVGIVKRAGDGVFTKDENGWMSYWEPEAAPNGNTACAVVIPGAEVLGFAEDDGNFLVLGDADFRETVCPLHRCRLEQER